MISVLSLLEADLERVYGGPQVWARVPVPQGLSCYPLELSPQHLARDLGVACSPSETHLEAVLCGDNDHFKGLPALEGDAGAPLLTAPFALFFGVEDDLGCVQPWVKVQGGVRSLLFAA